MIAIDEGYLQKEYPEIFECESLLYMGAVPSKWTHFLEYFDMGAWKGSCSVLELDPKNAQDLRDMKIPTIEGNFLDIEQLVGSKSFDVIIWEDGPEHIYEKDFDDLIPQLLRVAKKYVVMEAPEGIRGHDPNTPDLLDRQYSDIQKDTFDKYGISSFLLPHRGFNRVLSVGVL